MLTIITTFFNNFKTYFFIGFILLVIANYTYQKIKENRLEAALTETKKDLKDTKEKLDEANKNNVLMYEAYEKTLAIEREIAEQKLQTQEQKEKVVVKYKTLEKEIEKRGELKQDENSNFTIVSF